LARRLLIRDALATLNVAASDTNEMNDSYKTCMAKVNAQIFPARALQLQKRYMRSYFHKLMDSTIREHIARVVEINGFLMKFLKSKAGQQPTKLEDNKLLDILEFSCPNSWQRQMML